VVSVVFQVKEESHIRVKTRDYEKEHRELSDAMEKAINWLATQPVGTEVIVIETTVIRRTA